MVKERNGGREQVEKRVPMDRQRGLPLPPPPPPPIMYARERAFLRGMPRLAEGGRRRHVDESRAAGKPREPPSRSGHEISRKGRKRNWNESKQNHDALLACFRLSSIYFPSNLHVSPRVSSLFRAQHSCGYDPLPSFPLFPSAPPFASHFFFSYSSPLYVSSPERSAS